MASQTGDIRRLVTYLNEAWVEIQVLRRDWSFRFGEFTETVPDGTVTHTFTSITAQTIIQPTALVLAKVSDATQRRRLNLLDKQFFDDNFAARRATDSPGFPLYACLIPPAAGDGDEARHRIRFEVETDGAFTLTGNYQTAIQELTANADIPLMPGQYHDAIFYLALMKWAEFEEAESVFITARDKYNQWLTTMVNDLCPKILVGQEAFASDAGSSNRLWP